MGLDAIFAGDVHLRAEDPAGWQPFFSFLGNAARQCPKLYLLGDIFHCWIGDDDASVLALETQERLRELSAAGVQVGYINGNHDFMAGPKFGRLSGVNMLGFEALVTCAASKILLLHGDSLCREKKSYQWKRNFYLFPPILAAARLLPFKYRAAKAKQFLRQSAANSSSEALEIDEDKVSALLRQSGAKIMIHGHTHTPQIRAAGSFLRAIVPAWPPIGGTGGWLELRQGNLSLHQLQASA